MRLKEVYSQEIMPFGSYNFKLTASLYSASWEFDGENAYLVLIYNDAFVLSILSSIGDIVRITYLASSNDSELLERAISDVRFIFGLDENLNNFYELVRDDPLLGILSRELKGIHLRAVQDIWAGLIIGICQQNTSFYNGWKSLIKLRKLLGNRILIPAKNIEYYTYPSPESILNYASYLKRTGIGYRSKIILQVAKEYMEKEGRIDDIEELKYVGPYTSAIAKIMALREYAVFPLDRWFTKLLTHVYFNDKEVEKDELLRFIDNKWGKWKGLAAIFITAVTGAKIISKTINDFDNGKLEPFPNKPAPLTLWRYQY